MDKGTIVGGVIGVSLGFIFAAFSPGPFGSEVTLLASAGSGLLLGWFFGGMKGL